MGCIVWTDVNQFHVFFGKLEQISFVVQVTGDRLGDEMGWIVRTEDVNQFHVNFSAFVGLTKFFLKNMAKSFGTNHPGTVPDGKNGTVASANRRMR